MNILYLTTHLNIGGITSYVFSLSKGLKKRGHNVYIASGGGELLERFYAEGIPCVTIPIRTKSEAHIPKILASLTRALSVAREKNIQVIHSNTRVTQVLGSLLHTRSGIAHISTCHGFFRPRLFRRLFPCWGLRVIAISEAVKNHLVQDFGVPKESIAVVHNGIDIRRFKYRNFKPRAQAKKEFGLDEGPVVGIIGRLSDVKGHIYLIEAMQSVLKEIPAAQLFIVGEGRMECHLRDKSARLGIEGRVRFVRSVLDTAAALCAMDVFVMPSLEEGLGLSLMEAMAAGIAVIGSRIGGIPSLIQHGQNGLLVEPADSRQLSSAILQVLRDQSAAEAMASRAQAFIEENFSEEEMVIQTEGVYLECVNGRL